MPIHPRIDDESGLAYGEWCEGWKDIAGFGDKYEINHECKVRNKTTGRILKLTKDNTVHLCGAKSTNKYIYHLVLESFFPHIPRNGRTCDHFDENYKNNEINNLWWLTRSQQSVKSQKLRPRKSGPARSKPVEQWTLGNPSIKIKTFESIIQASQQTGIHYGGIGECANKYRWSAGGFYWKYQELESQKDLEGEQWKTNKEVILLLQEKKRNKKLKIDNLNKVLVSNLGRIQTSKGIKTKGAREGRHSCYRTYGAVKVHQLVWAVWGDGRPVPKQGDDLVIMHNDEVEKDSEGCVSNAICHLKLGTHSENSKSHSRAKAKKRTFSSTSE